MNRNPQPFQILVLTYSRLFSEFTKGVCYDDVPRDWRDARLFMEHKDWNSETIELRLRERMPIYLQDAYWQQHNFPAFGLFTQWNKFTANPIKIQKEVRRKAPIPALSEINIWCEECKKTVPADHFHYPDSVHPSESPCNNSGE